eukprot:9376334-Pyramimonas_sp.AAC.1
MTELEERLTAASKARDATAARLAALEAENPARLAELARLKEVEKKVVPKCEAAEKRAHVSLST